MTKSRFLLSTFVVQTSIVSKRDLNSLMVVMLIQIRESDDIMYKWDGLMTKAKSCCDRAKFSNYIMTPKKEMLDLIQDRLFTQEFTKFVKVSAFLKGW